MRHLANIGVVLAAVGLFDAAPALAQGVSAEQERQIRNILYLRIKARFMAVRHSRVEGLGADELEAMIRRGQHPYARQWAFKAFAACIRWPTRVGERIGVVGTFAVYRSFNAGGEALAECRSRYERHNCRCTLVDENDRNMLEVPKGVIALLARRAGVRRRAPARQEREVPPRRRGRVRQRRGGSSRR